VGIAVAGGAAVANLGDADRSAPPPAAPIPSPSPSALSAAQLDGLASAAAATLGIESVDNRKRRSEGKGPILMTGNHPVLRVNPSVAATGYSENETDIYGFEILCVGEGTLRARFWGSPANAPGSRPAPPPGSPDLRVPCGDEPSPATASVRAPWPQRVYVWIEADQAAVGHAAVAFLVRVP
jgi:hypothetical protein